MLKLFTLAVFAPLLISPEEYFKYSLTWFIDEDDDDEGDNDKNDDDDERIFILI